MTWPYWADCHTVTLSHSQVSHTVTLSHCHFHSASFRAKTPSLLHYWSTEYHTRFGCSITKLTLLQKKYAWDKHEQALSTGSYLASTLLFWIQYLSLLETHQCSRSLRSQKRYFLVFAGKNVNTASNCCEISHEIRKIRSWNLIISWNKCMAMNFYCMHKFLSDLRVSKAAGKKLKMIHAQIAVPRQKRVIVPKKSVIWFDRAIG